MCCPPLLTKEIKIVRNVRRRRDVKVIRMSGQTVPDRTSADLTWDDSRRELYGRSAMHTANRLTKYHYPHSSRVRADIFNQASNF